MSRVLLIEDDVTIREAVTYALGREGHDTHGVGRLDEARAALADGSFDLIVLDLTLPDGSGLELCRDVRDVSDVPIIVVNAGTDEIDRVVGLELGADDYVSKPFSMVELVSRVRAMLRRRHIDRREQGSVQQIGSLRLDFGTHEVTVEGRRVQLTRSEFRLLSLLASAPGQVFSRDEIMRHLWSSDFTGGGRTCDQHVVAVRRKIEMDPRRPSRLQTVRGIGYRLIAV
jgi:DNA-binding response OmpR family regulator